MPLMTFTLYHNSAKFLPTLRSRDVSILNLVLCVELLS